MTTQREIRNNCDVSARVVAIAAATTLTLHGHEGRICYVSGTTTITLPPALGTGAKYTIVHAAAAQAVTVDAAGTDVFKGNVMGVGDDASTTGNAEGWTATTQTKYITNGTTTGGVAIGDFIEVVDVASGVWFIKGQISQSGTEATPFAA
tara:strand:+ start:226 stop:675 length:450 start_codon:yes stop_codon:yes gene_type:complete